MTDLPSQTSAVTKKLTAESSCVDGKLTVAIGILLVDVHWAWQSLSPQQT
jgi:hypothetical protein